jgi:hypothetical protein
MGNLADLLSSIFFPDRTPDPEDAQIAQQKELERSMMTSQERRNEDRYESDRQNHPWLFRDDE